MQTSTVTEKLMLKFRFEVTTFGMLQSHFGEIGQSKGSRIILCVVRMKKLDLVKINSCALLNRLKF